VKNGKVALEWEVEYNEDNDDTNSAKELGEKGYTLPEYQFVARYGRLNDRSGVLNVKGWGDHLIIDERTGKSLPSRKCLLFTPEGKFIIGESDANGYVTVTELKIGKYTILA
jgi:hypothetical protein